METKHPLPPLIPFGQISFLTQDDFESVFREILGNRYYTNHGPIAKSFESLLETYLDVANVVTAGNDSLAMLIALASLEIEGEVIVPALGASRSLKMAKGLGLKTMICDVSLATRQLSLETIQPVITPSTEAVIVVETGGRRSDSTMLQFLNDKGIKVIVVAFHSFSSITDSRRVSLLENVVTLASFGPGQILTTLQGGAIITQNDDWAHRFRNMRSSYGVREPRIVKATCNGRFSEFQAGIGIKDFSYLSQTIAHNHQLAAAYDLAFLDGDHAIKIARQTVDSHNGQFYAISIPETSSQSIASMRVQLAKSGIETAGLECLNDKMPNARRISSELLFLPINNRMTTGHAAEIASVIESHMANGK